MPVTTTTITSPLPAAGTPAMSPLSVERPMLSPRKRKFGDASDASPMSLNEVAGRSGSCSSTDERVISPKKKTKTDERASGNMSKWESHVVAGIASALDLDCMSVDDDKSCSSSELNPIAFSAAPVGDLAADELQILHYFLT